MSGSQSILGNLGTLGILGLIPFSQLGVQDVPQAFTKQIEGQDDDQDGKPGDKGQPWRIKDEALSIGQNVSPRRMGWRNTKTKKTQSGLGQNSSCNPDGGGNKDRGDRIGDHVTKDDPQIFDPEGSSRGDKILFPQGQELSPHKTGRALPSL